MAPKLVVLREPGVPDRATSLTAWTGNPSSGETAGSNRANAGSSDRTASQAPESPSVPDQATAPDQEVVSDEVAPPDWIIVMDQTTRLQRVWAASLGLVLVAAMFAAGLLIHSTPLSA